MDYEEIERKRYERIWKKAAGKFSENPKDYISNPNPSPSALRFFLFVSGRLKTGSFLDIGCGNGRHTVLFANHFDSVGLDISKSAIDFAKKHAKEKTVKANFRVGSVLKLPYEKDTFDVVMDSGCFHHLRKIQWSLYKKNILKVLKKGGYYYLECFSRNTPHMPGFSPRTKNRNWTLRYLHYNHFFTDEEVFKFFSKEFRILNNFEYKKKNSPLKFKVFFMKKR